MDEPVLDDGALRAKLRDRAYVALWSGRQSGKLRGHQRPSDFAPSGGYWMEVDPEEVLRLVELAAPTVTATPSKGGAAPVGNDGGTGAAGA
jgi:hypothetical protein